MKNPKAPFNKYSASMKKNSRNKTTAGRIKRLVTAAIRGFVYTLALTALLGLSGCNTTPNIRRGSLASTTLGIPLLHPRPPFLNPDNLGSHSYVPNPFEKNGIVYTCDGGHIDIAHVRANADDTRYIVGKIYEALMKKKKRFSFNLAFEQSIHKVYFTYPENWDDLPEQEIEKTARELSLEVGAFVTFNATLWHEFMSWFGVRFALIDPQFNSAFSWEDVYSNMLGVKLAIEVLRNPDRGYNKDMTAAIDNALKQLRVQPRKDAIEITESMRGKWFKGNRIPAMLRRNTDIGTDDGFISPVLAPDGCEDAQPKPLAAPSLYNISSYGVTVTYKIVPVYMEANKVLKIIYPNGKGKYIEPAKDYPLIIDFINRQAEEKYHYDIGARD